MHQLIIIGSGPAAFTAAIYAARANLDPLLLEGEPSQSLTPGGQLTTTTDIENFPGFPKGINGTELVENMKQQAIHFGTKVVSETVVKVDLSNKTDPTSTPIGKPSLYTVETPYRTYYTKSIIIATGATAKKLAFTGSETFWMKGISACAVCDGALPIFRNKPLGVIGGGDTAMEEANFLSKYGSMVHVFVRSDKLRASKIMQDRVLNNPKITIHYNTSVIQACGRADRKDLLGSVILLCGTDDKTRYQTDIALCGLFYAIGHAPASEFLAGQVECDKEGYIITKPGHTCTSVPGVFAAGDVQDKKWRQAITAAGSGCMAALEAEHFLSTF